MSIICFCCFKVFRSVRAHAKECFRDVAWNRVNVEDIKVARVLLVMVLAYVLCFSPVIIIESIDFFSRGSYLPRQVSLFLHSRSNLVKLCKSNNLWRDEQDF